MKDYALLKSSHLVDRVIDRTGLTLQQLQEEDRKSSRLAVQRFKELGLAMPAPTASNLKLLDSEIRARSYQARRPITGVGFSIKKAAFVDLYVIDSICIEDDDRLWRHVSISRTDKTTPSYADLTWVKRHWIGDDCWAIQVFPSSDRHVSDHSTCLHLWSCLEPFDLPDFRKFGTI